MAALGFSQPRPTVRKQSKKIFIQRDYTRGTACRFLAEFPKELQGKIDEETFVKTIDSINTIFDDAESLNCGAYSEGCLFCLTGYTLHFCYKTNYERAVETVARYIESQNQRIYAGKGIIIGDPMDRGLRCIEVAIDAENTNIEA